MCFLALFLKRELLLKVPLLSFPSFSCALYMEPLWLVIYIPSRVLAAESLATSRFAFFAARWWVVCCFFGVRALVCARSGTHDFLFSFTLPILRSGHKARYTEWYQSGRDQYHEARYTLSGISLDLILFVRKGILCIYKKSMELYLCLWSFIFVYGVLYLPPWNSVFFYGVLSMSMEFYLPPKPKPSRH